MKTLIKYTLLAVVSSYASAQGTLGAEEQGEENVLFHEHVKPILQANCVKCHGEEKAKGGLRMHTRALLMEGGDEDLAVNLKEPKKSLMLELCRLSEDHDDRMPPKGPHLTQEEIAKLEQWIAGGVQWPQGVVLKPEVRKPSANELFNGLQSVTIAPPKVTLEGQGDYQSVTVLGHYADATSRDISHVVKWGKLGGIAKVDGGKLRPLKDGKVSVNLQFGGKSVNLPLEVRQATKPKEISFQRDVMPVLTAGGCNMGSCHGAARGQDGFQLSLFGFDAKGDHHRILNEMVGRRINLAMPEQSLLLTKGVGAVPHTGGKRIKPGSDEYRVLLEWVKNGAKYDGPDVVLPVSIEVFPKQVVMRADGETMALRVVAKYADGTDRDVTSLATFSSSNDASVAMDKNTSTMLTKQRGEAFVMARFHTFTEVSQVIVVPEESDYKKPLVQPYNYVDQHVLSKLHKLRVVPSEVCDDRTFIRRVYIDIIGKVPTPRELNTFIADQDPQKRSKLVDRLLDRKEFTDIWVMKWAELLQIRTFQNKVSYKSAVLYHQWLKDQFGANRRFDKIVEEVLAAKGGTFSNPATNFYQLENDVKKVTENVAQVFMGTRIQCAQCHNHPFDRWTMDDYYSFSAFFTQVRRKRGEDPREQIIFDASGEIKHPVTNQNAIPKFLGGVRPEIKNQKRRDVLAKWMVSKENPWFSRNVVNIIWAHYFGIGIVEPVDDVRVSNPPSNPELLSALAKRFIESDYDFKSVVRDICNSRTYQQSTRVNATNRTDNTNFSHAMVRRVRAEILLDIIAQVTKTPNKFKGLPRGASAVQIADGNTTTYFLQTFGRSTRQSVCSCEVKMEPNLSQALHLLNGETTHKRIREGKVVPTLLAKKLNQTGMVNELYMLCLSRKATKQEHEKLGKFLASAKDNKQKMEIYEDLFWALLNSKEFVFTH